MLLTTEDYKGHTLYVGHTDEEGQKGYWLSVPDYEDIARLPSKAFALQVAHDLIDGVSRGVIIHQIHQALVADEEHLRRAFSEKDIEMLKRCLCLKESTDDLFFDAHTEIER